jgi:hypothetical protein
VEARSGAFDPSEPVVLTVRAFDASYRPLAGANVTLTLERVADPGVAPPRDDGNVASPGGSAYQLVTRQEGVTGPDGEWTLKVESPGPGAYRARVVAKSGNAALGSDEDAFLVRQADREIADGAPRPELMAALSDVSGGTVVTRADDVAGLRWKLPEGVRVHKRKTEPLWDRAWVAGVLALLWATEWVLRRRKGFA